MTAQQAQVTHTDQTIQDPGMYHYTLKEVLMRLKYSNSDTNDGDIYYLSNYNFAILVLEK